MTIFMLIYMITLLDIFVFEIFFISVKCGNMFLFIAHYNYWKI